ncbi:3-oxoacyl-ACP synthase III family protein [Paenibacillus filicis]|uniref:3-oxoacyl-ACP synthase III family protein n=1 Tax=Paenibacillus gyeongsangnamensis TaxID=3388067 RepID=A0ABT4Q8P7_9BACL|nr:3-oxoacyl-ACP synthase III family protein [Paenibacillus filicis]MCZ8513157.1 3-oxoacyl-ACP synthase III family protein [Paenibacillus filicis]
MRIIGVGTALPGEPIPNSKMEEVFALREDWIDLMIGTKTRYFAVDLDEKRVKYDLCDLAYEAAQQALNKAEVANSEIDLIVMSTATPDHLMPATVNLVADRLGMNRVPAFEIQAGCSGAIQGLEVAYRFLSTGAYSKALVIGGDVCNKYMNFRLDFKKLRSSELINLALFGDGAGAAVLSTKPERDGLKIEYIVNRFEGLNREPGQVMNWFGSPNSHEEGKKVQSAKEDYKAIEQGVPVMAKEMLEELLEQLQCSSEDVNHYMPPQLGGHITDKIVQFLEIDPHKAINCVAETGNNGNALPYLQLERLFEMMKPGEKAVGIAIESSKWIKTGIAITKEEA